MASIKLANPLHYPLAVLAGGLVLIVGVRFLRLSNVVILPVAAVTMIGGAAFLQGSRPAQISTKNPVLDRELQAIQQQALKLRQQAENLRSEAAGVLTASHQVELLGAVEYACDRTTELPQKISDLSQRLSGSNSLLSVQDLQQQLAKVEQKQANSSGAAQQQWNRLSQSLSRNIQLAQQGEDARQAQVISLSTLILDAAGVLQQLQNKLRTANLESNTEAMKLRSLSEEFTRYQENVDLLLS
ncbi:MAG: hypothetical protein AAF329_01850 [Cyanobacteria bacterium P01_A01_bin.17]